MKTEREIFERWLKEEDPFFGNDNNPDVIWAKKFMFKAWIASAQRDGYKLVPVEPTERMLDAARRRQWDDLSSPLEDMDMLKYKAMIGAAE